MNNNKHRVVIVGGGYAGVTTAMKLADYHDNKNLEIVVVSKEAVMETKMEIDSVVPYCADHDFCRIWLPPLLKDRNIRLVQAEMTALDTQSKEISLLLTPYVATCEYLKGDSEVCNISELPMREKTQLEYDTLVLAMGANSSNPPIEGLDEYATKIWWVKDIKHYKRLVENRLRMALEEPDPAKRKELLTFVIIGGGATGVEICGPLAQSVRSRAKRMGLSQKEISISLIDSGTHVLKQLPEKSRIKADRRLEELSVTLKLGLRVSKLTKEFVYLDNNTRIPRGLCLFAGGARVEPWVSNLNLPMLKDRVKVGHDLLVEGFSNIYAIGDIAAFVPHDSQNPLPMLAQHALHMGETAANNILADINGRKHNEYSGNIVGQMVSIGYGYSVGETKGIQLSGWPADFGKKMSYALCWNALGGLSMVQQRWLESSRMKKYVRKTLEQQF